MTTAYDCDSPWDEPPDEPCDCHEDECPECCPPCHTCHGEGYGIAGEDWPADPIQDPHYGEEVPCPNCRGSGSSKDCWFW